MAENEILSRLTATIEDLVLKAHSSKNKEVSGLFAEIKNDLKGIRTDVNRLEVGIVKLEKAYNEKILPNLKTWNTTSAKVDKVGWLVVSAVIVSLLGLVLVKNIG